MILEKFCQPSLPAQLVGVAESARSEWESECKVMTDHGSASFRLEVRLLLRQPAAFTCQTRTVPYFSQPSFSSSFLLPIFSHISSNLTERASLPTPSRRD